MNEYKFNATNLIAEAFEKLDINFDVVSRQSSEQMLVFLSVNSGPHVTMRFISRDNDNDVAVRIFCLISNIPREKRTRVRDVCNALNNKIRYLKFSLDTDGDIQVMYDFPVCTPDVRGKMILPPHGKEFFHAAVSRFLHPSVRTFLHAW